MSAQSVLLREQRLAYVIDACTTPASVWADVQRKRALAASVQAGPAPAMGAAAAMRSPAAPSRK